MIAFLAGRIAAVAPGYALVDVGGVGYRVYMSSRSLAELPAVGDDAVVHTYLHVRDAEMTLYGFAETEEREAFESLLGVSGVGPKVALAVLSSLSAESLRGAVETGDVALLSSVPGVGRKTAQRIVVDLAGRLDASDAVAGDGQAAAVAQARDALLGMGFSAAEVALALKEAGGGDVESVLTRALRSLGGGR